jgi:uncharacterized protein YndB with AHSA1/START domain
MPSTVRLHRVLAAKPDKVYRAFIEADAKAKWLPPNGFACTVHHLDAKVGGTYRMSFRNFTTGKSHFFGGKYLELVPGQRLRYSDRFEDPNLPGEIQVTVALKQVSVGTELTICAGRHSRRHSGGGVLSRLAGVLAKSRQPRRARNQSIVKRETCASRCAGGITCEKSTVTRISPAPSDRVIRPQCWRKSDHRHRRPAAPLPRVATRPPHHPAAK